MVFSPLMLILLILLILAFAGSGYGYYSNGAYASPMGIVGAILLVCFLVCFSCCVLSAASRNIFFFGTTVFVMVLLLAIAGVVARINR